jgi:signal transduction histidine kinase
MSGCYDRQMGSSNPEPHIPLRFLLSGRGSSPIRRILLVGFSTIFTVWLISAFVLSRRVIDADHRVVSITTKFAESEEVLSAIRERVLLTSVLVRDAALGGAEGVVRQREQLQHIRTDVERRLGQFLPYVDSAAEREHWARLRAELDEYWASLEPLLTGQVAGSGAHDFLRGTAIPKHELVLRISEDLRILNQDGLREQQAAVTELHRGVRNRIWWTGGLTAVFGFAVALIALKHTGRLESWIRQQHQQEREHKRELQRLSGELEDAQENERRKIARDLHDEIGQALMTINLDLAQVHRSGQLCGAQAAALAEARASTDQAIKTVRDLSQLLHPPMLDDFGLAITLDAYVRGFSERSGVRAEIILDRMDTRVPADVEVCAYRIVQEALTNVAKHAQAATCRVYLQRLPHSLLVTVEDDGKGMTVAGGETPGRRGVGLVSVRERVSRAGGTVHIDSLLGKGTRLTAELPVASLPTTPDRTHSVAGPSPTSEAVEALR